MSAPHVIRDGKADRPGSGLFGRLTGDELQAAHRAALGVLPASAADSDELPAVLRAPVVVRRRDDAPVGPALVPVDLGAGDELRPVGRTLPGHDLDARSSS